VELEVRDLLKSYGFPGDEIPVIRGSALKAMDDDPAWTAKIDELMEAVDSYIPIPPAGDRQAVFDADRRHFFDFGPGHGGDGKSRARS